MILLLEIIFLIQLKLKIQENKKNNYLQEYLNENQNINEDEDLQIKYGRTLKELKLLNLSPLVKFSFFENGTVLWNFKTKKN